MGYGVKTVRTEAKIQLGKIVLENVDHFPELVRHLFSNIYLRDNIQRRSNGLDQLLLRKRRQQTC